MLCKSAGVCGWQLRLGPARLHLTRESLPSIRQRPECSSPFHVVGQGVQRHFGAYVRERFHLDPREPLSSKVGSGKRESLRALAAQYDRHVCLMGAE